MLPLRTYQTAYPGTSISIYSPSTLRTVAVYEHSFTVPTSTSSTPCTNGRSFSQHTRVHGTPPRPCPSSSLPRPPHVMVAWRSLRVASTFSCCRSAAAFTCPPPHPRQQRSATDSNGQ
eukprot:2771952-Rhodomonas_salina.1